MEINIFFSVFAIIFAAELPDKTAFATLLMATRGKAGAIFLGVAAAFTVQSLVAVCFGSLLGLLPEKIVHIGAGLAFLAFAGHAWFFHEEEEQKMEEDTPAISSRVKFWSAAWKAFAVIFIAEWGDLTQLATGSLAARYNDHLLTVFCAATLALWCVTGIAIFAGKKIGRVVHLGALKKISTILFAGVGVYFLISALYQ